MHFSETLANSVLAIDKAYSVMGLLHRDISYANIMLDSEGCGKLNDWDQAGQKDEEVYRVVCMLAL